MYVEVVCVKEGIFDVMRRDIQKRVKRGWGVGRGRELVE
jgi:hypothetical protein